MRDVTRGQRPVTGADQPQDAVPAQRSASIERFVQWVLIDQKLLADPDGGEGPSTRVTSAGLYALGVHVDGSGGARTNKVADDALAFEAALRRVPQPYRGLIVRHGLGGTRPRVDTAPRAVVLRGDANGHALENQNGVEEFRIWNARKGRWGKGGCYVVCRWEPALAVQQAQIAEFLAWRKGLELLLDEMRGTTLERFVLTIELPALPGGADRYEGLFGAHAVPHIRLPGPAGTKA